MKNTGTAPSRVKFSGDAEPQFDKYSFINELYCFQNVVTARQDFPV